MLFVQIDVTLRHVLFSNSVIEICSFSFLGWVEGRSGDTNSFVVVFSPIVLMIEKVEVNITPLPFVRVNGH